MKPTPRKNNVTSAAVAETMAGFSSPAQMTSRP